MRTSCLSPPSLSKRAPRIWPTSRRWSIATAALTTKQASMRPASGSRPAAPSGSGRSSACARPSTATAGWRGWEALVLEAARENGDIVSARKGAALYVIRVQGRSAHAGVEPEKGANAILELAHQIVAAQRLNGIVPGVTVSVGAVAGGTRSNVVP